jgi:hypothetical protein
VILEACQENQLSYEYRDGATPYGAFTFSLGASLRSAGKPLTFSGLSAEVAKRLAALGYQQKPCIVGPKDVINGRIPWKHVTAAGKAKRR